MFYELTTVVPRGSGFRYQSIHVLGLWDDYAYILLYGGNTADSFMKEALTDTGLYCQLLFFTLC